jgi:hypothetical protein
MTPRLNVARLTRLNLNPAVALLSDLLCLWAHKQHPDHQLWTDRGAAGLAVIGLEIRPDALELDNLINAAQQMVGRGYAARGRTRRTARSDLNAVRPSWSHLQLMTTMESRFAAKPEAFSTQSGVSRHSLQVG